MVKKKDLNRNYRIALSVFLVIGMLVSLFLLYEHFFEGASEFCTFGASLDCGVVNQSPYANLDGLIYLLQVDFEWNIPSFYPSDANIILDLLTANAFLGFLTLLLLFFLNTRYKNKDFLFIKAENNIKWIRGVLIFGVLYGLYLFWIQHSILKTYCIFCLALDFAMLLSLITAFLIKR